MRDDLSSGPALARRRSGSVRRTWAGVCRRCKLPPGRTGVGGRVDKGAPMKLWRYVIRNNDGSAPNYDPPFTALAICKPRIRKGARPGDLVLAFCGP